MSLTSVTDSTQQWSTIWLEVAAVGAFNTIRQPPINSVLLALSAATSACSVVAA